MCNIIFTLHQHCSHEQYQNTYPCHVVRRCDPSDTLVLDRAVFLFDTKKHPTYYPEYSCKKLKLKRPEPTLCDGCKKKQLMKRKGKGKEEGVTGTIRSISSSPAVVASPSSPGMVESSSTPDVDLESGKRALSVIIEAEEDDGSTDTLIAAQNTTLVSLLRMSRMGPGPDDSPGSLTRNDFSFDASPLSNREKQSLREL